MRQDVGKENLTQRISGGYILPSPPYSYMKFSASLLLISLLTPSLYAAPFIPAEEELVLERLPFKASDPVAKKSSALRAELKLTPSDPNIAAALAKTYYDAGVNYGDPRFISYAEASLQAWWKLPSPPAAILKIRAAIYQYRHEFSKARDDLARVLTANPLDAEALALSAAIYMVQARYPEAKADCRALQNSSSVLIASACSATLDALTGQLRKSYTDLVQVYRDSPTAPADEKLWVLTRLAEMQERAGNSEAAEMHYREALRLGTTQVFLLASYADFLLDQQRPAEALALLINAPPADGLLLRQVLAAKASASVEAARLAAALRARFAAANQRGDKTHQQEEARFALEIEGQTAKALQLAAENWQVQREPRDARILLEAALAAKNPQSAKPVIVWLKESGIEDQRLLNLKQRIDAAATLP